MFSAACFDHKTLGSVEIQSLYYLCKEIKFHIYSDNKHIDDYMRGWAGHSYIRIVQHRRVVILNDLYGGRFRTLSPVIQKYGLNSNQSALLAEEVLTCIGDHKRPPVEFAFMFSQTMKESSYECALREYLSYLKIPFILIRSGNLELVREFEKYRL